MLPPPVANPATALPHAAGMDTKRKYYPKKWQWAEAQAEAWRRQAADLASTRYPSSSWRHVRRKMDGIGHAHDQAVRFDALARRYRARDL